MVEKGPKNSGKARPTPTPYWGNAWKKTFFWEVFPYQADPISEVEWKAASMTKKSAFYDL